VDDLSRSRVSLSTGEAFKLSGHGLDGMSPAAGLAITCPQSAGPIAAWLTLTGQLCDSLISGWTERQAAVVAVSLHPRDSRQDEIAEAASEPYRRQSRKPPLDLPIFGSLNTTRKRGT